MTVYFFKTNMSLTDRCYDRESYDKLLAWNKAKLTINLSNAYGVVPNQDFFVGNLTAEQTLQLYDSDYILYTYETTEQIFYGAFITSIQPQAISGKFRISQYVDSWFMAKFLNLNFDFHGQCVRAHINDFTKSGTYGYKDLTGTYYAPEETYSNNEVGVRKDALIPQPVDETGGESALNLYIYLYINNPQQAGFNTNVPQVILPRHLITSTQYGSYQRGQKVVKQGVNGLLIPGVISFRTGNEPIESFLGDGICCFLNKTDYEAAKAHEPPVTDGLTIKLSDITFSYVTSIFITSIPPKPNCKIVPTNDGDNYISVYDDGDTAYSQGQTVDKLRFTYHNYLVMSQGIPDIFSDFENRIHISDIKSYSYEDFIDKCIVKFDSSIYNPTYVNNIMIDPYYDTYFSLSLAPDGTEYKFSYQRNIPGFVVDNILNIFSFNNYGIFAPDTVRDFWTRLNAQVGILSAQQKRIGSIFQGITSGISAVTGAAGDVASSQTAKGKARLTYGGGVTELVGDVANNVIGGVSGIVDSYYNFQAADLSERIANAQYNIGMTSSETTTGYYSAIFDYGMPQLIKYRQSTNNKKHICERLHRYGYNTFLQIDEVYKNHQRRHFNYFQCPNIEVHGLPLDMINDIRQMFANGVHLWTISEDTDEVGNFEVNNYPLILD